MISLFDSLLNFRLLEEGAYSTITSQGPFEVRHYRRVAFARILIEGDFSEALIEGKKHLQDYLEGSNFRVEKVPFTPFYFQKESERGWEIGVILNAEKISTNIPRPINRHIKLDELPPGRVGVLRCKGEVTHDFFIRKTEELRKWIQFKNYRPLTGPRLLYNDSLITLPFHRTKEVHLDLL